LISDLSAGGSRRRRRRAADAARRCLAAGCAQAMAEVFARSTEAPTRRDRSGAVARPAVDRTSGARIFNAFPADRLPTSSTSSPRQVRDAMRHRPPQQSAGLGLCGDRRSRHRRGSAFELIENAYAELRAISFPGIASSSATAISPRSGNRCWCCKISRRHAGRPGGQSCRIRWRSSRSPAMAERRSGGADRKRGARNAPTVNIRRGPQTATTSAAWCGICARAASLPPPVLSCARCSGNHELFESASWPNLSELPQCPRRSAAA